MALDFGNIFDINAGYSSEGGGGGSSDKTYVHEQAIASDTWTINHNLGKFPSITVVDTANNVVITKEVYIDKNTCVIYASAPVKGFAYLN